VGGELARCDAHNRIRDDDVEVTIRLRAEARWAASRSARVAGGEKSCGTRMVRKRMGPGGPGAAHITTATPRWVALEI